MRIKTFALCTASFAALTVATPSAAQEQQTPVDPGVEAQTNPADPTDGAPQTDDAVAGEGEEIVVTGIRRSLQSARNIKRNSEQIVDAVIAEDIGKLPDLAVSDTAARIPGVQVVRTGGEASSVLIRGLPDFATTYNGREIFTAETRVVALQDFPSANIAALEVFKTTTPSLVEAGLAGLVNVRSRRPFDFSGLEIAGSVWSLYTRQAREFTPNGNILVSNRWNTGLGEIGVLVNASYTQLKFLDSEPSNTDFIADPSINGRSVRFPDVQRLFYREGDRTRPSVNVALQWRPSDGLEFYVDGLYQGFRNKVSDRRIDAFLFGGQAYSNLVFREGTNLLSSGTVTNPGDAFFSFQGGTFNKTDTYQLAVGGSYEAGPLKITADLARTDSRFTGSTESVDRRYCPNGYTVDFDLETPEFTIRNCDLNNPANQLFEGLYEEAQVAEGDDYQARLDAEYTFGDGSFIRSADIGVRYSTRDAFRAFGNRFAGFGRDRRFPITALPLDLEISRRGFRGTDIQSGTDFFLTPTYESIRKNRRELRQFIINNRPDFGFSPSGPPAFTVDDVQPNPTSPFNANEETLAGYGQVNYQFGENLDGVLGVRVVQTKTDVRGLALVGQADPDGAGPLPAPPRVLTEIAAGQEFTDVLPSANLRWRFTPELQLRLSYTQTRTRPTFEQLNPSVDVGSPDPSQGGLRTGRGGNPNLQPINSNNYDVSLEYYFSRTGFASLAAFRRDVRGFIQDQTLPEFNDPTLGRVRITGPVNTRRGRIQGIEAQFSTFFDVEGLPDLVRNFGVQANYTYLDGRVQILNPLTNTLEFDRITSPEGPGDYGGVSRHTYNITGLYEGGPFSARLTYNKRSKYLDRREVRGGEGGGFYREEAFPSGRLDFSANYTANEKLTLFFDATNLTGDPFRVNFSSARDGAPRAEYVRYLRFDEQTFSLGARFRL